MYVVFNDSCIGMLARSQSSGTHGAIPSSSPEVITPDLNHTSLMNHAWITRESFLYRCNVLQVVGDHVTLGHSSQLTKRTWSGWEGSMLLLTEVVEEALNSFGLFEFWAEKSASHKIETHWKLEWINQFVFDYILLKVNNNPLSWVAFLSLTKKLRFFLKIWKIGF